MIVQLSQCPQEGDRVTHHSEREQEPGYVGVASGKA